MHAHAHARARACTVPS